MDVLMKDSTTRANKNGKASSAVAICESCVTGHRRSCERPIDCPCLCRRVQIVSRAEAAVLHLRWCQKLEAFKTEMEREAQRADVDIEQVRAMAAGA